jgi:hypothetical protein
VGEDRTTELHRTDLGMMGRHVVSLEAARCGEEAVLATAKRTLFNHVFTRDLAEQLTSMVVSREGLLGFPPRCRRRVRCE